MSDFGKILLGIGVAIAGTIVAVIAKKSNTVSGEVKADTASNVAGEVIEKVCEKTIDILEGSEKKVESKFTEVVENCKTVGKEAVCRFKNFVLPTEITSDMLNDMSYTITESKRIEFFDKFLSMNRKCKTAGAVGVGALVVGVAVSGFAFVTKCILHEKCVDICDEYLTVYNKSYDNLGVIEDSVDTDSQTKQSS